MQGAQNAKWRHARTSMPPRQRFRYGPSSTRPTVSREPGATAIAGWLPFAYRMRASCDPDNCELMSMPFGIGSPQYLHVPVWALSASMGIPQVWHVSPDPLSSLVRALGLKHISNPFSPPDSFTDAGLQTLRASHESLRLPLYGIRAKDPFRSDCFPLFRKIQKISSWRPFAGSLLLRTVLARSTGCSPR